MPNEYKGIVQDSGDNRTYPHLSPEIEQEIVQEMARRYRYANSGFDPSIYAYNPLTSEGLMSQNRIENHEVGRTPEDVFLHKGDSFLNTDTGQRGYVTGFSSSNKPIVEYNNGVSSEVKKENWLPPVEVKARRHRPADDLDKMFLGMMSIPFAAYGAAELAGLGIGAQAAWDLPIASQVAASNAPTTLNSLGNFVKGTSAFLAGDEAGNMAIRQFTPYNSWGEAVSKTTGMPQGLADWTNPLGWAAPGLFEKGASKLYSSAENAVKSRSLGKSSEATIRELFPVGNPQVMAYQIERYPGYQLKSLMSGNPLEKQLSKSGTVNVNNIRAHISKGSKMEKAVVDKVLASDKFAGQRNIDYNEFRKAVQDELISYRRVPSDDWADYGIKSLGFKDQMTSNAQSIRFNEETGEFEQIVPFAEFTPDYTLNTYTFESPKIGVGDDTHYNVTTLGHSRTYTTSEEPDVLHIMESQSDWGQHPMKEPRFSYGLTDTFDGVQWKRRADIDYDDAGNVIFTEPGKGITYESMMRDNYNIVRKAKEAFKTNYPAEQAKYLHDNYLQRQLQENLKYAAEHGQTKMRYPTADTAAKIEGYKKQYLPEDSEMAGLLGDAIYTLKLSKSKLSDLSRLKGWEKLNFSPEESVLEVRQRFEKELEALKARKNYSESHKTILKKYSSFPKQYKKLYKDAEVRTITDSKGNTWYEVDVPEDYLNQEWQYAKGGYLTIK